MCDFPPEPRPIRHGTGIASANGKEPESAVASDSAIHMPHAMRRCTGQRGATSCRCEAHAAPFATNGTLRIPENASHLR